MQRTQNYPLTITSQMGIEAYKVLSKEVNLKIKWSGSLEWFEDNEIESDSFVKLEKLVEL